MDNPYKKIVREKLPYKMNFALVGDSYKLR
nr:MAG TPA: hypothetical protein [Caudoviricetes sp.]